MLWWIRPDAARFLKPGTDPADVFPGYKSPERKYSPSQRRIPRGQTGGGRWTDEQGSGGGGSGGILGALSAIGEGLGVGEGFDNFDLGDLTGLGDFEALFSIKPSDLDFEGAQLAQNDGPSGYPVDLLEERELGGHTIEGHVRRTKESLLARVRRESETAQDYGFADGLRVGSFTSLEAANKLVNSTISRNAAKVDSVIVGNLPKADLDAEFNSPTGYEAYAATSRSQPYIRDTYGVRVVVVPDQRSNKGYRVDTAFPTSSR